MGVRCHPREEIGFAVRELNQCREERPDSNHQTRYSLPNKIRTLKLNPPPGEAQLGQLPRFAVGSARPANNPCVAPLIIVKRLFACVAVLGLLAACSGIPLRSIPRLVALPSELLTVDPAEFMLAIQVDARMAPPPDALPTLNIKFVPREPDAAEAIERKLPMRMSVSSIPALGLAVAPADRRWLIYSFPPESQAELARIQAYFKRIQAERKGKGGGSLSMGIAQDGVAADDPALAHTRWESWLQTSRKDGFFELWSGSIAELKKGAKNNAANSKRSGTGSQ